MASAFILALAFPAAADISSWSMSPLSWDQDEVDFSLGGDAYGAGFVNDQESFAGLDKGGATGALKFNPAIERDFDSGLVIALHASLLAFHDRLSNDRYGGNVFELGYGSVQTGLGTFELGDTDGAGYRLAVIGPKVDDKASIDDPDLTFFKDPVSGRAFDQVFTVRTEEGASLDYAKLSYYSPRLFGIELGFSFTPSEGKDVVPFVSAGPKVFNRQQNIWEGAANYSTDIGPLTFGASGAFALARDALKTAGHEGLTDWALGTSLDYALNDDWKVSLGGSFRQSNAYAFGLNDVLARGTTRAWHGSAAISYGSWIAGFEAIDGTADGSVGQPTLNVHGYEASAGYRLNANLMLQAGWQQLRYSRSSGVFYTGPRFGADAGFLALNFHV